MSKKKKKNSHISVEELTCYFLKTTQELKVIAGTWWHLVANFIVWVPQKHGLKTDMSMRVGQTDSR